MDIPVNVDVVCGESVCGRSTYIVLNPVTEKVTHIVVKESGFAHTERLVPLNMIMESTPNLIWLRCSAEDMAHMDRFIETEFIESEEERYMSGPYMMWPYALPESELVTVEHEQIPVGELAVRRGANVEARDGHVGHVDEFLVNPTSEHITHLVMREGHFWDPKDITIPVSSIARIEEDKVYLKLTKKDIEALPAVPVQR